MGNSRHENCVMLKRHCATRVPLGIIAASGLVVVGLGLIPCETTIAPAISIQLVREGVPWRTPLSAAVSQLYVDDLESYEQRKLNIERDGLLVVQAQFQRTSVLKNLLRRVHGDGVIGLERKETSIYVELPGRLCIAKEPSKLRVSARSRLVLEPIDNPGVAVSASPVLPHTPAFVQVLVPPALSEDHVVLRLVFRPCGGRS
jgi:hypothetical protein